MTEDQIKECTEEFKNGLEALQDAVEKGTISQKAEIIFSEALLNCLRAAARNDRWSIDYNAPSKEALFHISGIEPDISENDTTHEVSFTYTPVKIKKSKKLMKNRQAKFYEAEFGIAMKKIQKAVNKGKIKPEYAQHLMSSTLLLLKLGIEVTDWEIHYNTNPKSTAIIIPSDE